jgi:hypothetical protein
MPTSLLLTVILLLLFCDESITFAHCRR